MAFSIKTNIGFYSKNMCFNMYIGLCANKSTRSALGTNMKSFLVEMSADTSFRAQQGFKLGIALNTCSNLIAPNAKSFRRRFKLCRNAGGDIGLDSIVSNRAADLNAGIHFTLDRPDSVDLINKAILGLVFE